VCNKAFTQASQLKSHERIHARRKGDSTQEGVSPSPQ
jgi:hypothetical protein